MKDDDLQATIVKGGKNAGNTKAIMQKLSDELKSTRKDYNNLVMQYNKVVKAHNRLVDAHDSLVDFIMMQCGVLYSAITGDPLVDDPVKKVSDLVLSTEGEKGLNYFREGIRLFIVRYKETGDPLKAFEDYQNHILGGK